MLEAGRAPEALLPHYCCERVPRLARLAAAAHRGLLLRHLAQAQVGPGAPPGSPEPARPPAAGPASPFARAACDGCAASPPPCPPPPRCETASIAAVRPAAPPPAAGAKAEAAADSRAAVRKRRCSRSASVDFDVHCFVSAGGAGGAGASFGDPGCTVSERTPSAMRRAASVTLAMLAAAADCALGGESPGLPGKDARQGAPAGACTARASSGGDDAGPGWGGAAAGGGECSICCEEGAQVAPACGHTLCAACARQLCAAGHASSVPACPFCRMPIASFAPAPTLAC